MGHRQIAKQIAPRATTLFDALAEGYEDAVRERNEAIETAAIQATEAGDKDSDLNDTFAILAGVGAFLVIAIRPSCSLHVGILAR